MAEDKGLSRSQREEKVLKFWKENKIFEKTLEKKPRKGDFVFYEGPPTANGKPGIHHLESRAFKDAIPRYKTMQGYRVPRKAGWDTHGLPVELEVEKQLGIKSKREIEEYGIERFNAECKRNVWKYIDEWERFTHRVGYWVDLDNPYITYKNSYIDKVWRVISEVEKRGLLYKDYKVVPWCPRCGTALSSHELAQGYEEVKDLSLYVKFKQKGDGHHVFFLAWTTTPWTLPGNVALAVGPDIDYVKVLSGNEFYILAESRLKIGDGQYEYEIVERMKGRDLVGLEYEPLYPFLSEKHPKGLEKAFKIYAADFVTTEDGTGIVHTAVMYGQEDFDLGTKVGLPKVHLVNPDATFTKGTGWLEGRSVVDESLAVDILKDLQSRGLLFAKENHTHSYPFCWRCKTRLIYYARDSWYIAMSKLRADLVKENETIHWEPEHIKEGRFGEWLREVKDWAISRERYWGTPMPVWESKHGGKIVADSLGTLKKYAKRSGNKYILMRHGQAENNIEKIHHANPGHEEKLTREGREESKRSAGKLGEVDLVLVSPYLRTRETADIVCEELGLEKDKVIVDERLAEWGTSPVFDGKSKAEFTKYYDEGYLRHLSERLPEGESFADMVKRVGPLLYELESKYRGKKILIITHSGTARAMSFIASGTELDKGRELMDLLTPLANGEIKELDFVPLPHNESFELDLHRPYIDEVVLVKDGEEYHRSKEVMDVWLDSGAMPFASESGGYPADFISEAIDQTRGWFYTLHAVGVLMGRGRAFKNVICLGHILDKDGKKMSKSVGNVVEPFAAIERYGADALRLWMYSVNQPGESKNFDERSVVEIERRVFNLLDNVYAFYELYRDQALESPNRPKSKDVLDRWILERFDGLARASTESLDAYRLLEPVRAMRDFIDDLSTWYLRRSRERLKEGDKDAKKTLYFVLRELSKLLAPFAPFAAEDLYQKLRGGDDLTSVHLESWPHKKKLWETKPATFADMAETRRLVSLALEERQRSGLKIRQPLAQLKIKHKLSKEYIELVKDEVNVKTVISDDKLDADIWLDTTLTPDLEEEGRVREVIRNLQEERKQRGLKPGEKMTFDVPQDERPFYEKHKDTISKATDTELVTG